MCNNNGFGSCWIIILILILFFCCGNGCGSTFSGGGCGCARSCGDNCGCC